MSGGVSYTTTTTVTGSGYPPQPGYEPPYPQPGPPYPPPPVVAQPGYMPPPTTYGPAINTAGGPLGYLATVNQLIIKQEVHALDVVTDFQSATKYDIVNSMGQLVYRAEEESGTCARQCLKGGRSFTMHIMDNMGAEVLRLHRPFKCCGCCFPCWCMQELQVETPNGNEMGLIKEKWTFCSPVMQIIIGDEPVYNLEGPCCPAGGCYVGQDVKFAVTRCCDDGHVGQISKQWSGVLQEMFTSTNNFNCSFPIDIPVSHKALLLSAAFIINFSYFQRQPVQHQHHDHHHSHHSSSN